MKRTLMVLFAGLVLSAGPIASAADAGAKPDCTSKQKEADDASAAVKAVAKADLTTCKEKKAKEKTDCEKPLKEKAQADAKAAKDKAKAAKDALACCKNPKKKGCGS